MNHGGCWHRSERETLDEVLAGAGPTLVLLGGARGVGRTTLLRDALRRCRPDVRVLAHACQPLPDADQRAAFARVVAGRDDAAPAVESRDGRGEARSDDVPDWPRLLEAVSRRAREHRAPVVLALDDAHRLLSVRHRVGTFLVELWAELRAHALPVHIVLAGPTPHLERELDRSAAALLEADPVRVVPGPLELRAVAERVAAWAPADRLRAWAIFGGMPDRVRRLDPSVTLPTNVRQLLLEPDAPLLRAGLDALGDDVQSLPRYVSLLRGLAQGARDWGGLRRSCPDFENGSQMAPYVARLESLGLVEIHRSLDAGERSRNRRYEPSDPFLVFWYRFVLPHLTGITLGEPADVWTRRVRPALDDHVAVMLPRACREWLSLHGGELLPARARVVGGLWGSGYDMPVSGTLRTGAAVYGTCVRAGEPVGPAPFEELGRQIRETRWGFGREGRHRVVFSTGGFDAEARRAVGRDAEFHGVVLEDLVGR